MVTVERSGISPECQKLRHHSLVMHHRCRVQRCGAVERPPFVEGTRRTSHELGERVSFLRTACRPSAGKRTNCRRDTAPRLLRRWAGRARKVFSWRTWRSARRPTTRLSQPHHNCFGMGASSADTWSIDIRTERSSFAPFGSARSAVGTMNTMRLPALPIRATLYVSPYARTRQLRRLRR